MRYISVCSGIEAAMVAWHDLGWEPVGFADGWTDIPWRGKDHAPDGPRYKALGNSMAVPCMRWIGERINNIETQE